MLWRLPRKRRSHFGNEISWTVNHISKVEVQKGNSDSHQAGNPGGVMRYELIVIGSGPAGRRAAIQAAKLGKSVLVVENRYRVGGVSVHTGTIPSKTLRETVLNLTGWRERGFYGRAYRVKKDIEGNDLNARLKIFPTFVFGKSFLKYTCFGTLYPVNPLRQ